MKLSKLTLDCLRSMTPSKVRVAELWAAGWMRRNGKPISKPGKRSSGTIPVWTSGWRIFSRHGRRNTENPMRAF